jgi:hypothetical protein
MLSRRLKTSLGLYLASMLLLHVVLAWSVRGLIRNGYPDFKIFYTAAKIIQEGRGRQLYDEATQLRVQQEFVSEPILRLGLLPYNHPPFEALLFVPLSLLPYGAAFVAWDLINVGILLILPRLLRPHIPWLQQVTTPTCVLASLAFFPIFVSLIHGQDILVLLLLFALAFVALKNNSDWWAGCWLGLGLFRFHLLLPILFSLVWQRRTRAIYGFFAVGMALGMLSVLMVGWRAALSYPSDVLRIESNMLQRGTIGPLNMPNLHGLWADLPLPANGKLIARILATLLSIALVAFVAERWKRIQASAFPLGFCLCLLVSVMTAYHGFAYDLSLLSLAVVIVGDYLLAARPPRSSVIALLTPPLLLYFTPLQMLLWFRMDRYGLIVLVLLAWFWAITRATSNSSAEHVCAS